jgi:hypothetical protein
MILHKYNDPGHGWAKIQRAVLIKLGVIDQISHYSYQRGEFVYLEEDCDLGVLGDKLKERGEELVIRHHFADKTSKIRGYASFAI